MYPGAGFGGFMPPAIKNLLIINAVIFALQELIVGRELLLWFGVHPASVVANLHVWQVATYMFFHGDLFHIFFNLFALWMFGMELEANWGTKEFLRFYFTIGLLSGLSILLWNILIGSWNSLTYGASGAVFGILIAFALFNPDRYIYIWGVLPVQAKYLTMGYALVSLASLVASRADGISHIGHLGGMISGFFYIRHRYRFQGIGQGFFRDFFNPPRRW